MAFLPIYIFPFISCLKFIIVLLNLLINYYVLKERIYQDKYNWNTKMSDLPTLPTLCNYREARSGRSVGDSGGLNFFNGRLGRNILHYYSSALSQNVPSLTIRQLMLVLENISQIKRSTDV